MTASLSRLVITCEFDLEIITKIIYVLGIMKSDWVIFMTNTRKRSIECKHRLIKGIDTDMLLSKSHLQCAKMTSRRHISQEVLLLYNKLTMFQSSPLDEAKSFGELTLLAQKQNQSH